MITDEDMAKALDRIAHTADGQLLYRYLQKTLLGVLAGPTEAGALNFDNGRRTFASQLMGHMAKGIDESGGSAADGRPSERSVTFARVQPRVVAQSRGAGRRITADTHVPGYDTGRDNG